MAELFRKCILYFVVFSLFHAVSTDDICIKKSPCKCVFNNGSGYDLAPSATKPSFFVAQQYSAENNGSKYKLVTFYYHPCNDLLPSLPKIPSGVGTCGQKLSICRLENTMTHDKDNTFLYSIGTYQFLGGEEATQFGSDGRSIIYGNRPSQTTVLLVCADTGDRFEIYSIEEPNSLVLAFYSRNACMRIIEEHGRSFGSNLLIIFFTLVIFYLLLGIGTKKCLMGATGIEVIPNISFWMDLPNLVKDGWAFALNGFKLPARSSTSAPQTSPDPSSYDAI